MHKMRAVYQQKLDETRAQIERLMVLKHELERSVEYLGTCESCDPDRLIHSCKRCDQEHGCAAPELVTGLHGKPH